MELLRKSYANPNVVLVAAQAWLTWSVDEVLEFGTVAMTALERELGPHRPLRNMEVHFQDGQFRNVDDGQKGFLFGSDDDAVIISTKGVVVRSIGAYRGREWLFERMRKPLEIVQLFDSSRECSRVGVAMRSNIAPNTDDFRIEEYVVPRFDWPQPYMQKFLGFRNEALLILDDLKEDAVARIVIETAQEGRRGIDLTIDAMSVTDSPVESVPKILVQMKDIESHLFELTVTDETRKLYGVTS